MTLRDKIGQMFVIGFDGVAVDEKSPIVHDIEEYNTRWCDFIDYNYLTKSFGKNLLIATSDRIKS